MKKNAKKVRDEIVNAPASMSAEQVEEVASEAVRRPHVAAWAHIGFATPPSHRRSDEVTVPLNAFAALEALCLEGGDSLIADEIRPALDGDHLSEGVSERIVRVAAQDRSAPNDKLAETINSIKGLALGNRRFDGPLVTDMDVRVEILPSNLKRYMKEAGMSLVDEPPLLDPKVNAAAGPSA